MRVARFFFLLGTLTFATFFRNVWQIAMECGGRKNVPEMYRLSTIRGNVALKPLCSVNLSRRLAHQILHCGCGLMLDGGGRRNVDVGSDFYAAVPKRLGRDRDIHS